MDAAVLVNGCSNHQHGSSKKRHRLQQKAAAATMEDVCEGKDFSFPLEEQRVLELWARLDAFHEQLRRTEGGEEFIFYDGPPFATGLPHYGHILAGTIKDVVTRHQSMRGRHVMRRFGWDCHGLPVEFELQIPCPAPSAR